MRGFLGFFIARDCHTSHIVIATSGFVFAVHWSRPAGSRSFAQRRRSVPLEVIRATLRTTACDARGGFVFAISASQLREMTPVNSTNSLIYLDYLASFCIFHSAQHSNTASVLRVRTRTRIIKYLLDRQKRLRRKRTGVDVKMISGERSDPRAT
jgi:hypothetical protein